MVMVGYGCFGDTVMWGGWRGEKSRKEERCSDNSTILGQRQKPERKEKEA